MIDRNFVPRLWNIEYLYAHLPYLEGVLTMQTIGDIKYAHFTAIRRITEPEAWYGNM